MNRKFGATFAAVAAVLAFALAAFNSCGNAPRFQDAVNPLTYTDIPDNDIIRVGDDYYMVSTTMYFCPGAPVMHSRDLVHWRIVSYIYDVLEDDDVYNLRGGRNAYGQGQWATSLRYENGTYYALFIANDQRKTYVYKTEDIVNGPWRRTVIDRPMHDASMLFDDGRLFVVWGNGDLRITELEPDASAIKEGGIDTLLLSAPREGYGLRAEGAHFYHIGDWYYVLEIDWPRGGVRTETCWRSRDLLGPYESKVVLQGAFDSRADGVAQGAIVDTPAGDWYAIMFQDHGAVGRIPTIQPVTWEDGWPMMGDGGVPMKNVRVNLPPAGEDYVWDSDEFDSPSLALVWQWNHKSDDSRWSLAERPGYLRLYAGEPVEGLMSARNTLTQRTVGPKCLSEVRLDASSLKPGDRAGLCAFQSHNCAIGVEVDGNGVKHVVLRSSSPRAKDVEEYRAEMPGDELYLRLRYTFTPPEVEDPATADTARASYSFDGENWTEIDYTLKMRYTLDLFTGYRSALYCYSTSPDGGGAADFDYFRQEVL